MNGTADAVSGPGISSRRPSPIPAPDRHQIETLNDLYLIVPPLTGKQRWLTRMLGPVWRLIFWLFERQQTFNASVVDHLNRDALVGFEAHRASVAMIDWIDRAFASFEMSADDLRRHREALLAREQRANAAVESLSAAHEELRTSIGVLQHATQSLKREVARMGEASRASGDAPAAPPGQPAPLASIDGATYLGFEDQFRGTQDDIRQRLTEYLPIFAGASDVLDVGCGRGEFLTLLGEQGVTARGIDVNRAMVDVCREKGLDASEADALAYLQTLPDGSLGGLIAAQVVEHLEPRYLTAFLDSAFAKLRPGSAIVLETINPACWFAFFESYIRDITHVQALHPDTLKYLLLATGFQRVDIRYRAPYPEHDKLQQVMAPPGTSLGDLAETLNANVDKINRLLFTWLDYAAIGRHP